MGNRLEWIQQEIDSLKAAGLYNNIRTLNSPQGAWLFWFWGGCLPYWHGRASAGDWASLI